MIIRVWGIVNSTEVEFTPIPDRPGYWEGYAKKDETLTDALNRLESLREKIPAKG